MATALCLACGVALPPQRYQGNPRKWCSESCRMWALRNPGKKRDRQRRCHVCGHQLTSRQRRFCSSECRHLAESAVRSEREKARRRLAQERKRRAPRGPCMQCGKRPVAPGRKKYCSYKCARAAEYARPQDKERRSDHYRRRRAAKAGSRVGKVRYADIAARDGWKCHLCSRRVKPEAEYPDPRSGSLDHLIPLADGGSHSPENVALAHLGCNARKGVGGTDQLLLIG